VANERERLRDEERRFQLWRKKVALGFAVGFLTVLTAMLLIVKPVVGLYGKRLDLPVRDDVLFVLIVMAWATLGAFDLKDLAALFSGVRISFGRGDAPPKGDGGDDGA
jgi:hypothetical protein